MTYLEEKEAIVKAAAEFPPTFGLRAFPGHTFRIGLRQSYTDHNGVIWLYTQRREDSRTGGDDWIDFAKATPGELRREIDLYYIPLED